MANCNYEPWSLDEIATAISTKHSGKKEIVVPMFQRGKRWTSQQEIDFIDSLEQGYPVGTMLFFRSVIGEKEIYTLIDGLQRANTIRNYLLKPTNYVEASSIPRDIINEIRDILSLAGHQEAIEKRIREILIGKIQGSPSIQKIQCHTLAHSITQAIPCNSTDADYRIANILEPYISKISDRFCEIANRIIPVIVYSGDESTLPYIFDRINSKGTALTQYEVFAASWPQQRVIFCKNKEIVEYVVKKYDSLSLYDYTIKDFDKDQMRKKGLLNIFEIVFGFSKYVTEKFSLLRFSKNQTADEIEPIGFELINACLNSSKEDVRKLYKNLVELEDINIFFDKVIESINFVESAISRVTKFKGNKRTDDYILHSKYQILSMIAYAFREKYDANDLAKAKKTWKDLRENLLTSLMEHYIHDIITSEWNEGGTTRIFSVISSKRYSQSVSGLEFNNALNTYFTKQSLRQESKNVAPPSKEDIIILNTIYTNVFTASDQISSNMFDIEHLAPKGMLKEMIKQCSNRGLPISSIANLCYLPQKHNRSKGQKTIYQDNPQSDSDIAEIEKKYTFTIASDFDWIQVLYRRDDYEVLKAYYNDFLAARFIRQKRKFFASLGIEYYDAYDTTVVNFE